MLLLFGVLDHCLYPHALPALAYPSKRYPSFGDEFVYLFIELIDGQDGVPIRHTHRQVRNNLHFNPPVFACQGRSTASESEEQTRVHPFGS